MTTEEMIEKFIEEGYRAYRNNYRNCPDGIRLYRHEPVILDGIEFTCMKEYTVYKMGQYIKEICPTIDIEINLDGNDSTISASMTDEEQKNLNVKLYNFIKEYI